jgi:two-component sensor histidine kinase
MVPEKQNGERRNGPVVEHSSRREANSASLTLEQRTRQQELLAELGVFALRGASLDRLLDKAVAVTAEGLKADFCKVLEHMPEAHRFLIRAGVGWDEGVVGRATVGDDLASPAGYALRTNKPVISNHLDHEQRFRTPEILQRHGIRRAMNVILQGEGRPFGVLEVDSKSDQEFETADLAFLQGAANILGMAIERDRHERHLTAALERQRLLGREMSHRVKNSLAIVTAMLELQARQSGDPLLGEQLKEAVHRITAVAKAHELLYRGADDQWLDLGKYVEAVCKDVDVSVSGISCHLAADYGIEIQASRAIAAALIVNELIANAAKYAYRGGSGEVWIRIARHAAHGFSISVRDEGEGLPPDFDDKKPKGLGMRLVKAFARQLGGVLEIRRMEPGTEFLVTVSDTERVAA